MQLEIKLKVLDRKIRIGAVSYLNTKPLIYGLQRGVIRDQIELTADYPANVAAKLIDGSLDIGLVPVAVFDKIPNARVVGDACIACNGAVDSVAIFSEVPMDQINTLILDYQSRTSVALAKVLMNEYWKKEVNWTAATNEDFRDQIKNDVAAVVIGDRALEQKHHSAYMYDLGEAWKAHTGLPFVFACWIANKPIDPEFLVEFNKANRLGFEHLEEIVTQEKYIHSDLLEYYTKYIHYTLDNEKKKGMELFLSKLRSV